MLFTLCISLHSILKKSTNCILISASVVVIVFFKYGKFYVYTEQ
jgi:hypothetical protein